MGLPVFWHTSPSQVENGLLSLNLGAVFDQQGTEEDGSVPISESRLLETGPFIFCLLKHRFFRPQSPSEASQVVQW